MPRALETGDIAPDFSLSSNTGETVRLYDLLDHSRVVLFFYPKAFTPVCTAEVCGFRDSDEEFDSLQATVLGVSSDSPATLARFAKQYGVKYRLLADETSEVRRAFAVPKMFGVFPGRVTYVIGRDHRIAHITVAGLKSAVHISESLKRLQDIPIET